MIFVIFSFNVIIVLSLIKPMALWGIAAIVLNIGILITYKTTREPKNNRKTTKYFDHSKC